MAITTGSAPRASSTFRPPRDSHFGPAERPRGRALTYANSDRVRAEGFVNIPIAEGIAFRLAGATDNHDPYFKSVVSKRASLGDLGYHFVRGSLRFAPAGLDDRLEVIVRGSYYDQDDNGYRSEER